MEKNTVDMMEANSRFRHSFTKASISFPY